MARKPNESIEPIRPVEDEQISAFTLTLKEIKQNINSLSTKYFSTYLKIYQIQAQQTLKKEGKDIKFQILKGYSSNMLVDMTIWNTEINT